jgi:secreted Zn-dependent insulinase-like peptidase
MMVVSDNTDLQALKEKIVDFQYGFAAAFEQIDKKTVQGLQRALLEEMIKKPENIAVEAASYFSDWGDGNYSFDTADKIAVHIEDATKGDLVELTNKIFFDGVFMNSTIQLKGDDFKDSSYFSWQNVSKQ